MTKGLEALERIITEPNFVYFSGRMSGKTEMSRKAFEQRQKDFETIQKSLKALEIIKKKKVNVWTLLETKTYAEYNFKEIVVKPKRKLTQEEYELLKEVLKDD